MRRGLNNEARPVSNVSGGHTPERPDGPEPDVSAIVVNRNGGEALERCLDSLLAQLGVVVEIVVVDNGSSEEELRAVSRRPGVRLVPFSGNLGFARAVNEGLARTDSPFVLAVNNDARLAPDYVARLAARLMLDRRLAGAQGLVLRDDGAVDTAGLSWNSRGEAVPIASGQSRFPGPTEAVEIPGVSATAALYRREALGEVSDNGAVFDDSFFAYYEDVDLALRLSRAGWRFVLDPEAIAYHEGSRTGRRTPFRRALWTARNRWRTLLKNFDRAFLRRRLGDLLRADLAHARSLGLPGAVLLFVVWPRAAVCAVATRPRGTLLTSFPGTAAARK
jgi:GT2 family glycosyltransferase